MLASEVFITCAVTGSADSVRKNPNAQLVTRARAIIELLGAGVLSAAQTRARLGLAA